MQDSKLWSRETVSDQALQALTPGELAAYVRHELTEAIKESPLSADRLIAVGVHLARAGRADADAPALAWLAEAPSSLRLDAAASMLCGLWRGPYRQAPVPPMGVETLLRQTEGLTLDLDAEGSLAWALCEAMNSELEPELRARLLAALEGILHRAGPPVDALLRSRIESIIAGRS